MVDYDPAPDSKRCSKQPMTYKSIECNVYIQFTEALMRASTTSFSEVQLSLAANGFDITSFYSVSELRLLVPHYLRFILDAMGLSSFGLPQATKLQKLKLLYNAITHPMPDGHALCFSASDHLQEIIITIASQLDTIIGAIDIEGEYDYPLANYTNEVLADLIQRRTKMLKAV